MSELTRVRVEGPVGRPFNASVDEENNWTVEESDTVSSIDAEFLALWLRYHAILGEDKVRYVPDWGARWAVYAESQLENFEILNRKIENVPGRVY